MGFKLASLAKLQDTRTWDNKETLIQYLVEYIDLKRPELLPFKDLASSRQATKVSFREITSDVTVLGKNIEATEKKVQVVLEKGKMEGKDSFPTTLPPLLTQAKKDHEDLSKLLTRVTENYNALCVQYAEVPSTTPPEQFFAFIANFIDIYKKAKKEVRIRKAKEAKLRERHIAQRRRERAKIKRAEESDKALRDRAREARKNRRKAESAAKSNGGGDNDDDDADVKFAASVKKHDGEGSSETEKAMNTKDMTEAIMLIRGGKANSQRTKIRANSRSRRMAHLRRSNEGSR